MGTDLDAGAETTTVADLIARRTYAPGVRDMTPSGEAGAGADAGSRPPYGPSPARRDGLLRDLAAVADDVPLVLLVAPAGYGKTMLLRQWADEDDRGFGWVQLRESDNDP